MYKILLDHVSRNHKHPFGDLNPLTQVYVSANLKKKKKKTIPCVRLPFDITLSKSFAPNKFHHFEHYIRAMDLSG